MIQDRKYPRATLDLTSIMIDEGIHDYDRITGIHIIVRDDESWEPAYIMNIKNIYHSEEHHTLEIWVNNRLEWSSN